jgi:hypothetical protein
MKNEEKDPVAVGEIVDIFNNDMDSNDFSIDYLLTTDKVRNDRDIYYKQEVVDDEITYTVFNEVELINGLYKKVYTYPVNTTGKYYV